MILLLPNRLYARLTRHPKGTNATVSNLVTMKFPSMTHRRTAWSIRHVVSPLALLAAAVLTLPTAGFSAVQTTVNNLGVAGWYADDNRDAAGTNLVGVVSTHAPRPGQTPTAADDTAIAGQIFFDPAAPGSVAALRLSKTAGTGAAKSTISRISTPGFAVSTSTTSWADGLLAELDYYTASTAELGILKLGIQSSLWSQSQTSFTATRSGESSWDLILVDWRGTNPGWTVGAWDTLTTDENTVCWRIYRQAGNTYFNAPPASDVSIAQLRAMNNPANPAHVAKTVGSTIYTWADVILGSGSRVTNIQLGVGSSNVTSTTYIDRLYLRLGNGSYDVETDFGTTAGLPVTSRYRVAPVELAENPAVTGTAFTHDTGNGNYAAPTNVPPGWAAGAPVGYGMSSLWASVINHPGDNSVAIPDRYRALRIIPDNLFGREVKVGEVAGISYRTRTTSGTIDWRLMIYTKVEAGTGNAASWYRSRLGATPSNALSLSDPDTVWNTFTTDSGTNQLRFADNRTGFTSETLLWSAIRSGPVTVGPNTWTWSLERLQNIDLILGANTGGGTGIGQLDAVVITLTDGTTAEVDLEQILHVNGAIGTPAGPGTETAPFATVPQAMGAAAGGETILVAPGIYDDSILVNKLVALESSAGAAETVLRDTTPSGLGVVQFVAAGSGSRLGGTGAGFTVEGIDRPAPGIEWSAVYIQGTSNGVSIIGNTVVAAGDAALMSEFGQSVTNLTITDNIITGQTFAGTTPAGDGFGSQFSLPNVPRQLVVLGSGAGTTTTNNIVFSRNQVLGVAGGTNGSGQPQGNTLVTIDADQVQISGNLFAGLTTRFAETLRVRGPNTSVTDNVFNGGSPVGVTFGRDTFDALATGTLTGNSFSGGFSSAALVASRPGSSSSVLNATGNWWGTSTGPTAPLANIPLAGPSVVGFADASAHLTSTPSHANTLLLRTTAPSLFIRPSETAVVNLEVANLAQPITGLQTFLTYNSAYFNSAPVVVAGGGVWSELLYYVEPVLGSLDVAVGIDFTAVATSADATTAVLTLTPTGLNGVTNIQFRPGVQTGGEITMLTNDAAEVIIPATVNSANIVVDGIAPSIGGLTATQPQPVTIVNVLNGTNTTLQGTVTIVFTASDALAGLVGTPVLTLDDPGAGAPFALTVTEGPTGTFTATWSVTAATENGTWTGLITATDRADNVSTLPFTLVVNKNEISGQITLQSFVGTTRSVRFVATNASGSVLRTWDVALTGFVSGTTSYELTNVPAATANLSAKTNWSLRRRLAVAFDSDSQATVDFTGTAGQVRAGDVNGSNSVNVQDFAIVRAAWFTTNAAADITGNGGVNNADYLALQANWFQAGDPQ